MAQQSFGPGRSAAPEAAAEPAPTSMAREQGISMSHELERISKMFVEAPDADTLKCSFQRDHMDRFPARIDVEIKRDADGSVSITAKDSLYHEVGNYRYDMEREPELFLTTRVAIGADGNLVRAIIEDHRAGQIEDKGGSYMEANGAVGRCYLHEVERYATGHQRGGNAEMTFERAGELVKKVDVEI